MTALPIIVEQLLKASPARVWGAITNKEEMKKWYFDLQEFIAEPGFEFSFYGGTEGGVQYLHLCEVTEAVANTKLSYSWRYDGYAGISHVSFELEDNAGNTLMRLTHSGLESFPQDNKDFARVNFENGWKEIIGTSLPQYLEGGQEEK